jgi:hypothetical protein
MLGTRAKASSKEAREEVNILAQQIIATKLESAVKGSELDQ